MSRLIVLRDCELEVLKIKPVAAPLEEIQMKTRRELEIQDPIVNLYFFATHAYLTIGYNKSSI